MTDIINFNIPKIRREDTKDNLRSVPVNGRDAKDVLDITQRSYLVRNYQHSLDVESVQLVENKTLEDSYRTKKAEMKEDGRHSRELIDQYAYLMHKDGKIAQKIAQDGLKTRELSFNSLGNSKLGVYVCKHADVQLQLYDTWNQDGGHLMVFKVILGRSKAMNLQPTMMVDPTPNYDSHINQLKPSPMDLISVQNNRSQIYLYEYDDDCEPVQRPRHCLPYAVITYKKTKDSAQNIPVGSNVNRYSRSVKSSEVKIPETIETGTPGIINPPQKIQHSTTVPSEARRQLSKQERRELFEKQHAESLRRQHLQDGRMSSEVMDPNIYHSSSAFSKVQTRHDPRVKNAPLGPPQSTNIVKPKSPTHGIDQRRPSNEKQHPGIGYQKQLFVNIPRHRHLSGGSPSPDGDSSISDALTDLIVKNQVKVDAYGRPVLPIPNPSPVLPIPNPSPVLTIPSPSSVLPIPSPSKLEEERQRSLNQQFADEIQKHLQMTGIVEIPQVSLQEDYTPQPMEIEIEKPPESKNKLDEDYTPQPMEIEATETIDSKLDKNDELEFDSKISELLNEASLQPLQIKVSKEDEVKKDEINEPTEKLSQKSHNISLNVFHNSEEEYDDDDDKLVIAEMDVEGKKREEIEKRKAKTEESLEPDLLTFVSREDIKKKDSDKGVEIKQSDSKVDLENDSSKTVDIVVVKEETMNKTEQMKMQREKILKEVQSMLVKSKEKSVDEVNEVAKKETTNMEEKDLAELPQNITTIKQELEQKKESLEDKNEQQNVSNELIDYELSKFSSDSESGRSDDEGGRYYHSRSPDYSRLPPLYYDSPTKVDPRGPYDVQTSPLKCESKSDTWIQQSRNLYNAYSDQNDQKIFDPRSHQVQPKWTPEQNMYRAPVPQPHMTRPPMNPQHLERPPFPPFRNEEFRNNRPHFPDRSRSDSDLMYQPHVHQQGSTFHDTDYRQRPNEKNHMDFLNVPDMDYRQNALIDVNPETGDVDYRRLNPVKPVQNQPVNSVNPNMMVNQFPSNPIHHNQNMPFNSPLMHMSPNAMNQSFTPIGGNAQYNPNNYNMLSPPMGPANWGKTDTIGLTSPSKDKKITFKDYKARRKNSPVRNESQKSDAGFDNFLHTDLDLKNLKNILETVNVVSALKKDFNDSKDENLQTRYIDDVTKSGTDPGIKQTGKLSFFNDVKNDDGLFNCYGTSTLPGLEKEIPPDKISISAILGTQIDMKKFENKDVDMRPQITLTGDQTKMATDSVGGDNESMSLETTSEKMTPPSSCSSPRGRARKSKIKKDMMGYVKRRRPRRRGRKNLNDNISDITGETGSVASSDWKSSIEDLGRIRVMSLEEVGLNHWTDAINHPLFQPRVVLKRQKEAELGAAAIAERNELQSEIEVLDSQPAERHSMVRQWVETSHKKIKLITLKRTKDDDIESVKSSKSGSGVTDDSVDIDLVEKQIAQDMAKSDDVLSISSSSDVAYQKPGPKCSKKPKLVTGHQSIPVLHKRKISSDITAQQSIVAPSTGYTGVQSSQGQVYITAYPSNYSIAPPSSTYLTHSSNAPYPVQGQPPHYLHQGHMNPPQGLPEVSFPNSTFGIQAIHRLPNSPLTYPAQTHIPVHQFPVPPPNFSQPPPNTFRPSLQSGQSQHQQPNFAQRLPDISQPPPSGGMQVLPNSSNSSQVGIHPTTTNAAAIHQPPSHHSQSLGQSLVNAIHLPSSHVSLNASQQVPTSHASVITSQQPLRISHQSSSLRNPTPSASHQILSQPRLHSPQIRPIVAQANFLLGTPHVTKLSHYPPTTLPVAATECTTPVTSVCTTSTTEASTPTSTKKPSDVADWFADKLNPKAAQESQGEKSLESNIVKPKEGSLREELEKIRKSKMDKTEEKVKPEKRKSLSRERSPVTKFRRRRNGSSEYSSDGSGNESSDSRSKFSRSSYSPSSRGSSRRKSTESRRWRYNSPGYRRRYSSSPRSRQSRSPSDSPNKKSSISRKSPKPRSSDSIDDIRDSDNRRRRSNSKSRKSMDSERVGNRSSPVSDRMGNRRSPDSKGIGNRRSPVYERMGNRRSPVSERIGRRRSPGPDRIGNRSSPDADRIGNRRSPNSDKIGSRKSPDSNKSRFRRFTETGRTRRRSSSSSERTKRSPGIKRQQSKSPQPRKLSSKSPEPRRRYSNSPESRWSRKSPPRRSSNSPVNRKRQTPDSKQSPKDKASKSDSTKRHSVSPKKENSSPKQQRNLSPKQTVTYQQSKISSDSKQSPAVGKENNNEKEEKTKSVNDERVKFAQGEAKSVLERHISTDSSNNKWTKSNFTEYTVEQINEEDKKLQEELRKLEEQKKMLEEADKKFREEQRKKEDERIRNELKELEKQKKLAEELLELQKQRQFTEELAELERQKKLAEELIELDKQRKIAEELVELEKKKQTAEEEEELEKRKRELEKEVNKPISLDEFEEHPIDLDNDVIVLEGDSQISDELHELAQQKEALQRALDALENADKESDCYEVDSSGLEDGEIEDDSEEEVKKDKIDKNKKSVIDVDERLSTRDRRSTSGERRSVSSDRRRTISVGSDHYEDSYSHRQSSGQSDVRRQHAKEIGNAWGAMISHNDTRVERIKGDPFFQKKTETKETENLKEDLKPKSLSAKLKRSELITACDISEEQERKEEQQRKATRQELVTFADWLKMEYKLSDDDVNKYQKYITCVDLHSRIDENSKNKRKTLKKRLRSEMQAAQERIKIEEDMKTRDNETPSNKPVRSVVISGVKERLESEKDGDRRIVCDSGVHQLSEIESLQEPFNISRQQLISELEMVRSALKMSWKTPKVKPPVDKAKNESLGFGEGDYDHEFLMRHDLQQLEAEILMRINHYEFYGVPNRRVPEMLLTKSEKNGHFSEEGIFLVLTASISHKAYQNLLSLKRKLESTESLVATLNPITHGQQILKHLQDTEVLHQSRKAIMLTIAGYPTKKRFSKLSTRLKYYKRCMSYIKDLWETELEYLKTTIADVEVHLKLGERLLHEQEAGVARPVVTSSDTYNIKVPVISNPPPSNWRNVIATQSGTSNTPPPNNWRNINSTQSNQSSRTARESVETGSQPGDSSGIRGNFRNVELKVDEYIPLPRNPISSHTTPNTYRNPVTTTQTSSTVHSGLVSGNLRQVPFPTQPQSTQESKLQRQNSNEHQNRPIADIDERKIQNDPRYVGIGNKSDSAQPVIRGESAALSSPYTLPPPRYLTQQERQPLQRARGPIHGPSQSTRSQHDIKLESDLMTVRDKLLHLSQQLRHDDSVRMSVQSVLLSVTEALGLLREESSNLPKVKEIILECLSRYNAVKELMEG